MSSAVAALQSAIFAALEGDSALVAELGGPRIYDQAPASVAFPHITFGATSVYDGSTGTESGTEQLFTLHIWSKAKGKKEVLEIMERARSRLDDAALTLSDGHQPVSLKLEFAEARFDNDLAVHHGLLRFRAVSGEAT
jgi:hypothetical protein